MKEIKNVYIETYGCSANQNNSEIIAGLLQQAGLSIVKNLKIADLAILNTCIVKGPTEQRMISRIKELYRKFSYRLVVAGCMPDVKSTMISTLAPNASLVGSHNIHSICNVVKKIIGKQRSELIEQKNEIKLCMPKLRQNGVIGITQILEGCLGECAYCITRYAKGRLFSYPQEKILQNIKQDLQNGCKEVWLTSQDNAAYGIDNGDYALPELLNQILSLKGRFMLRLGMMNPNHVLKIMNDLLECYRNEKMFKFLHLPLQSGSNKVLRDMKRQYGTEDFSKIVDAFKERFPSLTLSTDVIVGYPTETDEDFKKTLGAISKVKPNILNISKFWAHEGTEANKLK
jgi:MiaB-like tRNA modifying enzyme